MVALSRIMRKSVVDGTLVGAGSATWMTNETHAGKHASHVCMEKKVDPKNPVPETNAHQKIHGAMDQDQMDQDQTDHSDQTDQHSHRNWMLMSL